MKHTWWDLFNAHSSPFCFGLNDFREPLVARKYRSCEHGPHRAEMHGGWYFMLGYVSISHAKPRWILAPVAFSRVVLVVNVFHRVRLVPSLASLKFSWWQSVTGEIVQEVWPSLWAIGSVEIRGELEQCVKMIKECPWFNTR